MKLNVQALRYMTSEDFRVLTAVEMGAKNHLVVPTPLIFNIAGLKSGGAHKIISELAKNNLISRVQNAKYDGYRLTYGGYDYLAVNTLCKRGTISSVGHQIGVGKESDIFIVASDNGSQYVLKLQRLGRVSFRNIKNTRDYLQKRKSASWMYMSRLGATKEFAFMTVLHQHGFPVPRPVDHNRHCVVMELIDGLPLYQIQEIHEAGKLYAKLMALLVRLAQHGLIHGDFNEFNILITKDGAPIIIDFPQMVSTSHENAEFYFDRDVECVRAFFRKRFQYETSLLPSFSSSAWGDNESAGVVVVALDKLAASHSLFQKDERDVDKDEDDSTAPLSANYSTSNYAFEDEYEEVVEEEECASGINLNLLSPDVVPDEHAEVAGVESSHKKDELAGCVGAVADGSGEIVDPSEATALSLSNLNLCTPDEDDFHGIDNRDLRPFRDTSDPSELLGQAQSTSNPKVTSASSDHIRRRVQKSLKFRSNAPTTSSKRNRLKGKVASEKIDAVKYYDAW